MTSSGILGSVFAVLALAAVGCANGSDEGSAIEAETTSQTQQPLLADTLEPRVYAGATKSCVIEGGKLYCAGNNDQYGQTNYFLRVNLPGLPSVIDKVAIGGQHMCVLGGGAVTCWGNNDRGQVGCGCRSNMQETTKYSNQTSNQDGLLACTANPACTTRNVPPTVVITSGATDIFASDSKTCAIVGSYTQCWGASDYGQLGVGNTSRDIVSPTYVCAQGTNPNATSCGVLGGAQKLALGASHVCAIVSGVLECWGMNSVGQIGQGWISGSVSIPTPVPGVPYAAVDQVVAGANHTCALGSGGAYCWGSNSYGQIGDGTTNNRLYPFRIPANGAGFNGSAAYVAAGAYHSCAVSSNNTFCWGDNAWGQLADGTRTAHLSPSRMALPDGWGAARVVSASGATHTLIQHPGGGVYGMGSEGYGQLGCGPTGVGAGNWCSAFEGQGRIEGTTVENFYKGFLGRGSDRGGYMFWVNQVRDAQCSGDKMTVHGVTASVASAFLECPEWWGRCSTYTNAFPATWNPNAQQLNRTNTTCNYSGPSSAADYVLDAYAGFLQRTPDQVGWNFWTQQILNGGQTRDALRWSFLGSPEYIADGGVADRIAKAGCMPHIR